MEVSKNIRGHKYKQIVGIGWKCLSKEGVKTYKQNEFVILLNEKYKQKIHASAFNKVIKDKEENIDQIKKVANCIKLFLYESRNLLYDETQNVFCPHEYMPSQISQKALEEVFQIQAIFEHEALQKEGASTSIFVTDRKHKDIYSKVKKSNLDVSTQKVGVFEWFKRKFKSPQILKEFGFLTPLNIDIDDSIKNYVEPYGIKEAKESGDFRLQEHFKSIFRAKFKEQKYYAVLADSGMGKTTFLFHLWYLCYYDYLLKHKEVYFLSMGSSGDVLEIVKTIKNKDRSILFLDAFDEDLKAIENTRDRLDEVVLCTEAFDTVVLSSRLQFFDSAKDEPGVTNLTKTGTGIKRHIFQKCYIAPFTDDLVDKVLRNYYRRYYFGFNRIEYEAHRATLRKLRDLKKRPLLLKYTKNVNIRYTSCLYLYEIYEAIIYKWAKRDEVPMSIDTNTLIKLSQRIAHYMYTRKSYGLTLQELGSFSSQLDKNILKSRSLLTRREDDLYAFAHKSFLEYLLAVEIYEKHTEVIGLFLFSKELSDAQFFYKELLFSKKVKPFLDSIGGYYQMRGGEQKSIQTVGFEDIEKVDFISIQDSDLTKYDSPLSHFIIFEKLHILDIQMCGLSNLLYISYLRHLQELRANYNQLKTTSLEPLKKCISLELIQLAGNGLTDISSLGELQNLWYLDIHDNPIKHIDALKGLSNLRTLHISGDFLEEWDILLELKALNALVIYVENAVIFPKNVSTTLKDNRCDVSIIIQQSND